MKKAASMSKQANDRKAGASREADEPNQNEPHQEEQRALMLRDERGAEEPPTRKKGRESEEQAQRDDESRKSSQGQEADESSADRSWESPRHTEGCDAHLTRLGPYKVLKLVGEGAAAIVYHAEQEEPVARQVALKLIKREMAWEAILHCFNERRRAWSRLDDPHIARVLDVGSTRSGQPYLVAQWVDGAPITQYCDENSLSTRQRLELFVPVCKAVQFAHQKGVFHGCLKPSNVRVADEHDQATPMVLDFGWRQAVGEDADVAPNSDAPIAAAGDLVYLSPEQVDANYKDIDAPATSTAWVCCFTSFSRGIRPCRRTGWRACRAQRFAAHPDGRESAAK